MPLLAAGNFLAEIVRNTNERGVRQKMTTNTRASLCRFGYLLLLVFLADWSTTAKGWAQASHVSASEVLCEYRKDPIGIDALHPRLSWVLTASQQSEKQTAYEILVASSKEALAENQADIWETGKVISAQSIQIPFQGKSLQSGTRYYWKVRVWDKEGRATDFSEPGYWEMGLLSASDWQGDWMGYPPNWNGRGLYFHYAFSLDREILSARAYIAGLGYYELHINGQRIGDHVLDPGMSSYEKRIFYSTYDVTNELKSGANAIGVVVGNGWYGFPKLRMQVNVTFKDHTQKSFYTAGMNATSTAWQVTASPIMQNSVYGGEIYDARMEKKGWDQPVSLPAPADRTEAWFYAVPVSPPGGVLVAQIAEPIKIMQTLVPKTVSTPSSGIYVFDTGQNLAGWAELLYLRGAAGTKITMKFAETLRPDGTVDQRNLRTATATDAYTLSGDGEEKWEPRFTYHGFRYVQVEGFPGIPTADNIRIKVVRSSLDDAGSFFSSNELVNRIQKMVWWTEASNLYSIPTDCPQRDERMGWMNDLTVRLEESLYNFNGARFYTQFADDVQDSQDANGSITDTVPWQYGSKPADPVDESYMLIGWLLYQNYGDTEVIKEHYDSFRAWVEYLRSRSPSNLINYGYYGDWSSPEAFSQPGGSAESKDTPLLFMSQGYYFYALQLLSRMASVIDKPEDAKHYSELAEQARKAFNDKYWDGRKGGYATNNQASNSFGFYLNTVPAGEEARLVQNLERDVEQHNWHLTTGNLATKYLLEMLSEHGHANTAFRIATQTTYPGWGYMLNNDATTLWERWELLSGEGMNSHNHPMMGSVSSYFYKYLAGINSDPSVPGFKHSIIHPYIVDGLDWVKATHHTMYGDIAINWDRKEKKVNLHVVIPVNTTATVFVPSAERTRVLVDGKSTNTTSGIHFLRMEAGSQVFEVDSGSYDFTSAL
jgi:alpha-L-rhamnosidase